MKKFRLNDAQELTRVQQRSIIGGNFPDDPGGGSGGSGEQMACCWDHDQNNCSSCKMCTIETCTCVTGAHLSNLAC